MNTEIRTEEVKLYGKKTSYRTGGEGPVILLVHGITGSYRHWDPLLPLLAERYTVIAPDLLGHGNSAKPRGDYSLGAHAAGVRDLLVALGHERATVVGHSLGGGIAMQFAYQFPERCDRLVLVSSGGLGEEVSVLLRAAALPGSELVLPLLSHEKLRTLASAVGRFLGALHLKPGNDLAEMAQGIGSLSDGDARQAFLHTLRAVIDPRGQRVSAHDRLHLTEVMPSLVVWGERDPIIPVRHGREAHVAMPGSRLEILPEAGHFPQLDEPYPLAKILSSFMDSTEASDIQTHEMRELLLRQPKSSARKAATSRSSRATRSSRRASSNGSSRSGSSRGTASSVAAGSSG
jgi:pimeloyl-ACP methyl ester carboxylesterase